MNYPIDAYANVVRGDEILFEHEGVMVEGRVVDCCYRPWHEFVVRLLDGPGVRVKARELYKTGVRRKPWADEGARRVVMEEKFRRSAKAQARVSNSYSKIRREMDAFFAPRNHQFQTT
jgi:hypothetical protein